MNPSRSVLTILLLSALAAPAAAKLSAQTLAAAEGWHTVRPGDTLERLAVDYLGTAGRWGEIARLNPGVVGDPRRLQPGQRLRVPLGPQAALAAAQIRRLSRQVDAKPTPIDWNDAHLGDLLVERDGVRTSRRSSAEMRFLDGTRLTVTEDSLVFLRRAGRDLAAVPADRRTVEIIEGQADIEKRSGASLKAGPDIEIPTIEIIVGGTRAVSRPSAAGLVQTRARRAEAGSAKVMLYGGQGEVEAGGAKVDLAEGMGTSVAASGPPGTPEKLLMAPRPLDPPPGARRASLRPSLSWDPVPGATSYVVEVCRDAECGELLDRAVEVTANNWRPDGDLPAGEVHWRATARSASGLDGYPAAPAALTLGVGGGLRAAAATLLPAEAAATVRVGETLFVGPAFQLEPQTAGSTECAVERTIPMVDGKETGGWPTTWTAGDHSAAVVVVDRCGNRSQSAPMTFRVDTAAPTVRWEVSDSELFEDHGEPQARLRSSAAREERRRERRRDRERARRDDDEEKVLYWSADGRGWIPLVEEAGRGTAEIPELRIDSSRPQVFVRGTGSLATGAAGGADSDLRLNDDQVLRLYTEDTDSGVARLTVRWKRAATTGGKPSIAIEAVDLVGNTATLDWPVTLR